MPVTTTEVSITSSLLRAIHHGAIIDRPSGKLFQKEKEKEQGNGVGFAGSGTGLDEDLAVEGEAEGIEWLHREFFV